MAMPESSDAATLCDSTPPCDVADVEEDDADDVMAPPPPLDLTEAEEKRGGGGGGCAGCSGGWASSTSIDRRLDVSDNLFWMFWI